MLSVKIPFFYVVIRSAVFKGQLELEQDISTELDKSFLFLLADCLNDSWAKIGPSLIMHLSVVGTLDVRK